MWKQNLHREKNCKTASWTLEENKYFPDLCITVTNIRTGLDCYCLLPGELWWRSSKKLLYKDPGDNEPRWWLGETLWKAFDSTYQVSEQHSHCPTDTWGGTRKPIDHPFVITWKVTTLAKYTPEEDVVIIVTVAVTIKSVATYYGVRQKSFR